MFQRFKHLFSLLNKRKTELDALTEQGLQIGKNFRNNSAYPFDALFPWLITVGDNVCFSANVKILAHDTSTEYVTGYTKIGTVTIGNNVYLGYGVTVLCNVRIGDNCIIGAGSVVTKDVPSNSVYGGNPAKFICTIDEYTQKHKKAMAAVPLYDGPCMKWHHASAEEKNEMKKNLSHNFGYMK